MPVSDIMPLLLFLQFKHAANDVTEALLDRIVRLGKEFPPARAAVVAERDLAPCEWLVRESGAVHFCVSPREAGPLARLAVRHLEAAPQPERTLVQQIWDELPWG